VPTLLTVASASAHAQTATDRDDLPITDATRPVEASAGDGRDHAMWSRVIEADRARLRIEQTQAWTLFGWGLSNIAEGAITAGVHAQGTSVDSQRAAAFGGMTAAWGAVNLGLAIPWVLRLPRELAQSDRWMAMTPATFAHEFERARDRAQSDAAFFALMCGIDVAYATAGTLMTVLGERTDGRNAMLSGFGIAVLVQGIALLAYDGWNWSARARDSARFRDAARASVR
jgi:hypothetical protein